MSSATLVVQIAGDLMGGSLAGLPLRVVPAKANAGKTIVRVVALNQDVEIEVDPGAYLIEADLPTGEVMSDVVRVGAGERKELVIEAPRSSHEWMRWARVASPKPRAAMMRSMKPSMGALESLAVPPSPWTLLVQRAVGVPIEAAPTLAGLVQRSDSTEGARSLTIELQGAAHAWVDQAAHDGWRFYLQNGDRTPWLACLPIPWLSDENTIAPLQIVMDETEGPSILVQDPRRAAILAFLAAGDFAAAKRSQEIVPAASEALEGKRKSPLAAAAGGYILLQLRAYSELHDWPRNLASWFDWMPDGAIIHATQLMHARPDGWWKDARDHFVRAAQRGAPIFSIGVRLLRRGLAMLAADAAKDTELARALAFAEDLAARADPDCIFTWLTGLQHPPVANK